MDQTRERARVSALRQLQVLDTPAEERFDRVVRIAQRIFDVPIVAVTLIDAERAFVKAATGMGTGELPRSATICTRTIESGDPLIVSDMRADPRFVQHPAVNQGPHLRFYAGQPLAAPGGELVGALCIVDDKPREMSAAQTAVLRELADWVEQELARSDDLIEGSDVQRRLLPSMAPHLPGYDVAGRCIPARHVGGDFFDWYPVQDAFQVVVADVMGKGVGAALIAASTRSVLRQGSLFNKLAEAVRRTALTLEDDLSETSSFVTLFTARLTPETGDLEYVDAGHGLAIVIPAVGVARHLGSHDLPLGALTDDSWTSRHDRLEPGDTMILVSDGILDFFPDPQSAIDAATALCRQVDDAGDMVDRITDLGRGRLLEDDITAVVWHRYMT